MNPIQDRRSVIEDAVELKALILAEVVKDLPARQVEPVSGDRVRIDPGALQKMAGEAGRVAGLRLDPGGAIPIERIGADDAADDRDIAVALGADGDASDRLVRTRIVGLDPPQRGPEHGRWILLSCVFAAARYPNVIGGGGQASTPEALANKVAGLLGLVPLLTEPPVTKSVHVPAPVGLIASVYSTV